MDDRGVTLAELGRRTGLAKGTLHRVCGDLVAAGLLERRDDLYRLGRLMFELGMRASVERDLLEVAGPFLEELAGGRRRDRAPRGPRRHRGRLHRQAGRAPPDVRAVPDGRAARALLHRRRQGTPGARAAGGVRGRGSRGTAPAHPADDHGTGDPRPPARAGQADGSGLRVRGVADRSRLRGRADPRPRRATRLPPSASPARSPASTRRRTPTACAPPHGASPPPSPDAEPDAEPRGSDSRSGHWNVTRGFAATATAQCPRDHHPRVGDRPGAPSDSSSPSRPGLPARPCAT